MLVNGIATLTAKSTATAVGIRYLGSVVVVTAKSTASSLAAVNHAAVAAPKARSTISPFAAVLHPGALSTTAKSTLAAVGKIWNDAQLNLGSLALHIKLNDGTGTTSVFDQCGNSVLMSGFVQGDWVSGVPALGGTALHFDGVNNYLTLPNVFNFSSSMVSLSVSMWIKTTGVGGLLGQGQTGGIPSGTGNELSYVPSIYVDNSGYLRASMFWHNSVSFQNVSLATVNDGSWHHILCSYGQYVAGGVESLYIDGVLQASQIVTQLNYSAGYVYWLGVVNTTNWPNGPAGWNYFTGDIDDFRVYTSSLLVADAVLLAGGGEPTQRGKSTAALTGKLIAQPPLSGGSILNSSLTGAPYGTFSSYGRAGGSDFGI